MWPLGLLLLAGCSAEPPESASETAVASPAPVELTAANGRDYPACADGNCEVLVSGPVEIALSGTAGITKLVVRAVEGNGIRFETQGDGTSSGSLSTNCVSTFYENGSGSRCSTGAQPAPEPTDGVVAMQLAEVRDGTAILRVVSGKPGPPPASLAPRIPTFEIPKPPFAG
ncbi:hypothetical protein A4R43_19680 [Amycolatopsis albispora]|uniref:Uncharacterized protein n=1 Tax=Amycolatopsis albispora TaxID=1804986 RepID=A0A344LKR7_9PSEU|nr:hypothetical protein A4R43_19680 [Amycolatopsis albispora]